MQVIFQDDQFIAVNKPSGLLVHRSMIDRHETRFAMQMVRDLINKHVFAVHRLDKPTSGVLLFALNREAASVITTLFAAGEIKKNYLAICRGYIDQHGVIDYSLREQLDKMTDAYVDANKPAQKAITRYKCLARIELPFAIGRYQTSRYSYVQLEPLTGRKHQIRRHMKHIYHPIIGDTTHGDGKHNTLFRDQFNCDRLLLHSSQLSFVHPYTKKLVEIIAPLDENFSRIVNQLGNDSRYKFEDTSNLK